MKNQIIEYTIKFIFGIGIGVILGYVSMFLIDGRIQAHERLECQRWQREAIEFSEYGYYLTQWQLDQCDALGEPVELKEPIKRNYTY